MNKKLIATGIACASLLSLAQVSAAENMTCTMEYAPVCGAVTASGTTTYKTYSNACVAKQSDAKGVDMSMCDEKKSQKTCTGEYNPVCGETLVEGVSHYEVYGNACVANASDAKVVSMSLCTQNDAQKIVDWAHSHKLTKFDKKADFRYDHAISRQEAAAMAVRMAENILGKKVDMSAVRIAGYNDHAEIDPTLSNDVTAARFLGIMNGHNNVFSPKRELSYAEALAMLIRAVDGKNLDESGEVWYLAYADRAAEIGLTFANFHEFDTSMSRGDFIEWAHTLANNPEIMKKIESAKSPVSATGSTQTGATANIFLSGSWVLNKVSGFTDKENTEIAAADMTLSFSGNRMSAKICNTIFGEFGVKDGTIAAPHLASTMMMCHGTPGKVEALFLPHGAMFQIVPATATKGGKNTELTITTTTGTVFTFAPSTKK